MLSFSLYAPASQFNISVQSIANCFFFVQISALVAYGSRHFLTNFLQEGPTPGTGPYFDTSVQPNVTGLVGKTVLLVCKVKNLGNRTVRKPIQFSFLYPYTLNLPPTPPSAHLSITPQAGPLAKRPTDKGAY